MKKINWWKLVWVLGIYIILGLILYLVIEYKVKWESLDTNKYLYFYDCDNKLCTSTTKVGSYYSRYTYKKDSPYIVNYDDDTVIINDNGKYLVYDYKNDKVVSDSYDWYEYLSYNNNTYFIMRGNNKVGIIDNQGSVIVNNIYDNIVDYCVEQIEQGNYDKAYSRYKNSVLVLEEQFAKPALTNRFVKNLKLKTNN